MVLMNDPVYVEAARALAQRVLREEPSSVEGRLRRAFRLSLARVPTSEEMEILDKTYQKQRKHFEADPDAAKELLKVGESPVPDNADTVEIATMTAVANVLLNLNEALTK